MRHSAPTRFLIILVISLIFVTGAYPQETAKTASALKAQEYIPDIGTFLQIGNALPLGYSWDGQTVFFQSSMPGAMQAFRINDSGWPYQLTAFADGIDFFIPSWGSDMAIVGASVGGSEQSQLYLLDTETGQPYQLTHFEDVKFGSVVWDKDDRAIYFRSNQETGRDFFIYRMDIATLETSKIFGDTAGVQGYMSIANLSQDGQKMIIYHYLSNVSNELFLLDLGTGEYNKLTGDGEGKNVIYHSAVLMPDNNTIWLVCNDNEDGIERLAKMKVESGKLSFAKDGWIDEKWTIDNLIISRDYRYMTATVNEGGYYRLKMREIETRKELPSPDLNGIMEWGEFASDSTCLIGFSGPTRAQNVWKWNPYTEELTQLTFSTYAGIDRNNFADPELVSFTSFDGLEIPAFLYLPPDYVEGKPIPFIVHAHGGPESQFRPYFMRNIQYLLLNGFGLIAPNPRGSTGYGKEYTNLDNYKNRKNSLRDYKAAVDFLIESKYTEPGMIGIRGDSYGGYVVLGMITEYPDMFSAAIDVVGIANFKTFLERTKSYRRALRESEYGPLSDPDFLKEISPIHKADQIKTPLLVVHGENDPRVPVSEARQIIEAILNRGGEVDSLIFPDEGHGSTKRVNIIAEYRKQVEFFSKYLKSTPEPEVTEEQAIKE